MKKILLLVFLISLSAIAIGQTGVGWGQQRSKVNFKDSTNFIKLPLLNMIDSVSGRSYARSVGLYWSGSATKLNAATGRTSLGGTTVGQAFFTLTNPGAITFPRINTDNSVSALTASDFRTAIGTVHVYSDTISISASTIRTKVTTLTTLPYSVQIFSSGGTDITNALLDSVALNGGVVKLYIYSVAAISGAEIKIIYGGTSGGGGGSGMIYPAAGIALSAGTYWGSSITNNSTNWNTAYTDRMKWDGGATGLVGATARTSLSLENVTNESKTTMFTNSTFTGILPKYGSPVTDTLATRAYARAYGGTDAVYYNVKNHGVAGDGLTADGLAIRACIANNRTLFFPRGTYLIDTILALTAPTNFKMLGEAGTIFLVNQSTNGTGNYGCISINGITSNVEISNIDFRVTATYVATEQPPIIYVGNSISATTNLSINNCRFYAPNVDMNAVYMLGNAGIYDNIRFTNNTVDSIGRIGIELYEDVGGYANEFDSTSYRNVTISDNYFSYTGIYGNYGLAISFGANDVNVSNNNIYNHLLNQAIEVGHSYRVNVSHNIVFSQYASAGISNYRNHNLLVTDNVLTFTQYTAAAIGANDCSDFTISNNTIKGYKNAILLYDCDNGYITENNIRMNRTTGIWIENGCSYLLVSGNKIDMIDTTDQYGAIRISKSDNGAMSGTENNIIQDNIITSGQVGMEFVVYNVNKSLNTVTNGSLIKTKVLTVGVTGDTQADEVWDLTQNNTTEQVLTFADVLPSNCRIISFELVCVTSVTGSGSTELNIESGISSSGAELVASASCNVANEVRGIIDAAKLPAIEMYWNGNIDQYSFRSIYLSGTPTANWNTLTAGKWRALLTYIDYRYK